VSRYLVLICWVLLSLGRSAAADSCEQSAANSNVVEISIDGLKRIASGVVITDDGYVVTAAHPILESLKDSPVPIALFVRTPTSGWENARVKRLDATLDLALIKLGRVPASTSFSAVRVVEDGEQLSAPICLLGSGIYLDSFGNRVPNAFAPVSALIQGSQLGYLFADKPLDIGYSGGGAFIGGEFAGIILRKNNQGTFILPAPFVVEFVALQGIFLKADRSFEPGTSLVQLSEAIDNIRRVSNENGEAINTILHSLNWTAELKSDSLVFTAKRAFPSQLAEGTFYGHLEVYFDDVNFVRYIDAHEPLSIEIGVEIPNAGVIEIKELQQKYATLRAKYQGERGVALNKNSKPTRLHVTGYIVVQQFKVGPIALEIKPLFTADELVRFEKSGRALVGN
jgi:hypothetical protein